MYRITHHTLFNIDLNAPTRPADELPPAVDNHPDSFERWWVDYIAAFDRDDLGLADDAAIFIGVDHGAGGTAIVMVAFVNSDGSAYVSLHAPDDEEKMNRAGIFAGPHRWWIDEDGDNTQQWADGATFSAGRFAPDAPMISFCICPDGRVE